MALLFSAGRERLDSADWSVTASSGGSLSPGTYYFSIQGKNRIGKNLLRVSNAITVPSSGKVTVTVNPSALKSGEGWTSYVIGVATSPTETAFNQVAGIPVLLPDGETLSTFPLVLEFTLNEQLLTEQVVTAFPTTGLLNGRILGYSLTGLIYEYQQYNTTSVVDSLLVFNATGGGRWVARGNYSTYVDSLTGVEGCLQDVRTLSAASEAEVPTYDASGAQSDAVTFWLTSDSGNVVPQGTRVDLSVRVGEVNKSQFFDGKLILELLGYVNTTTGVLRTLMTDGIIPLESVGIPVRYNAALPNLVLDDDLQVGEAYAVKVRCAFLAEELEGYIPEGAFLSVLPQFSSNSGVYSPIGVLLGDGVILPETDLRRVVPDQGLGVIALSGSGLIRNYQFPVLGQDLVGGLQPNLAGQKIIINKDGNCYYSAAATIPPDGAVRAVVSTIAGESAVSPWSSYQAVSANSLLMITANYPCDTSGYGTIRLNYPDAIAGSIKGRFNPPKINLYVQRQSDGAIRKFSGFNAISGVDQAFNVADWVSGTAVTEVPSSPFGLFAPTNAAITPSTGGLLAADSYRVAYAFEYTGSQVTDITHSVSAGCIVELSVSLTEVIENLKYWQYPVTAEELLTISSATVFHGTERKLLTTSGLLQPIYYNQYTTGAGNGTTIFKPNDKAVGEAGRWEVFPGEGLVTRDEVVSLILALGGGDGDSDSETGGGTTYTDEQAQDAVGTILVDSSTIDFTYDDTLPSITGVVVDGSVTDAKLGDRTVDQTLISPASTGSLTQLLSWIAGRIQAVTGKPNWFDAPDTTLTTAHTHHSNTSNPHGVTAAQVGADPSGTATSTMTSHTSAVDPHSQYLLDSEFTTHTSSTGNSTHIPSSGVTDANVATGAAITWSKISKTGATPGEVGADPSGTASSLLTSHTSAVDPHSQYATDTDLSSHTAATGNSTHIPSDGITDTNVATGAAIAESKLSLASDAAAGTASRRTLGTGAQQACAGNDSRVVGAIQSSEKGAANGVATLDSGSKIPSSQLPASAITDTFVVSSQASQLALVAQTGDVVVRTDLNKCFILQGSDPTLLSNWQELLTPTDVVQSVFGRTGVVSATAGDYSAGQITLTPTGNIAANNVQSAIAELDTEKQPIDSELTAIAALSTTSYGRNLLTRTSGANLYTYLGGTSSTASGVGYHKMPDGWLVQTGSYVVTLDASGNGTLLYPVSFTGFVIPLACNGDTGVLGGSVFGVVQDNNLSSAKVSVRPNPGATTVRFNLVAIGI